MLDAGLFFIFPDGFMNEHTEEVLAEFGLPAARIRALLEEGVVS